MRVYAHVLRHPRMAALLSAALVARLPIGINGLALVLFLREQTGSFSVPGAVAGGLALGVGFGAPFMGRTVDRHGARVLLAVTFVVAPLLVAALVATIDPAAALVLSAAAVVVGVGAFVSMLPPQVAAGAMSGVAG